MTVGVGGAAVDHEGRYGTPATRGGHGGAVGHGAYVEVGDGSAAVAFAIAEEMQAKGPGTIMLGHLARAAERAGIEAFVAEILPQIHKTIEPSATAASRARPARPPTGHGRGAFPQQS
ncbi:MAG: hypothetical protein R2725_09800 [Solirubrobacterales bacterium]